MDIDFRADLLEGPSRFTWFHPVRRRSYSSCILVSLEDSMGTAQRCYCVKIWHLLQRKSPADRRNRSDSSSCCCVNDRAIGFHSGGSSLHIHFAEDLLDVCDENWKPPIGSSSASKSRTSLRIEMTSVLLFFRLATVFIACWSERDELVALEVVIGGGTWQENILLVFGFSGCYDFMSARITVLGAQQALSHSSTRIHSRRLGRE